MGRKYRCRNWPRAGISSVSRVSARSSRNESSTGICAITGSPGLGISNPLNLSIPQRGIGIADEFWKPQSNLPPIIHAPFERINRGFTCPVTHYKGLSDRRLLSIPRRRNKVVPAETISHIPAESFSPQRERKEPNSGASEIPRRANVHRQPHARV